MIDCSKTKNYLSEKLRMTKRHSNEGIAMDNVELNVLTVRYLGKIMVHPQLCRVQL